MLSRAYAYLGNAGVRHFGRLFSPMKEEMRSSNISVLFEIYVGKMITFSLIAFLGVFSGASLVFMFFGQGIFPSLATGLVGGLAASATVVTIYHTYPFQKIKSKKSSIEANQPFAQNHMAAISASGVPPFVIFKLLANIPEYGEVSKESGRIVRNVDKFGMDMISAIKNVADRTPSEEFKQFLYGIVATIDTGGDLKKYLDNSARDSLFNYRLRREKYMQTLSTYADFYTAVLIAAPLFFVSVLSVMSMIGGSVMGLSIPDLMRLGIFVLIPVTNIAFIAFINFTQPSG